MLKVAVFTGLFTCYILYTFTVYTKGTEDTAARLPAASASIQKGKQLFQQYNCISCHQLYGLGGYLGPELTTASSDPARGDLFMRAFLQAGGTRMPNFHFSNAEIDDLISYLKYVDATAVTYKIQ